jgi:hypothetical protein
MPQWDFVCNKCGDPQTVLGKITEYEEIGLKENLCQVEGTWVTAGLLLSLLQGFTHEHT